MCKSFKGMAADSLQYGDHRRRTRRKEGQPGSALGGHETVNKALLKPVLEGDFISSGVCQDVTYRFQHGRLEGSDEVVHLQAAIQNVTAVKLCLYLCKL